MSIQIYFDGSYGPRFPNGTAAYGFVVKRDGETIFEGNGRVGSGPGFSCNVGEAEGLYQSMVYAHENFPDEQVVFYGDSTLVINLINGVAKARKGHYLPYYEKAEAFAKPYIERRQWSFEWIVREMNHEADELAQYSRYKEKEIINVRFSETSQDQK